MNLHFRFVNELHYRFHFVHSKGNVKNKVNNQKIDGIVFVKNNIQNTKDYVYEHFEKGKHHKLKTKPRNIIPGYFQHILME